GLVAVRVEALALRRLGLDPDAGERREQLLLDEADALRQVVVAVLGLVLGGGQRAVEVVERGQQLAGEARRAAALGGGDVAPRALADVVELGDRAEPLVLVVGLRRSDDLGRSGGLGRLVRLGAGRSGGLCR